MSEIINFPVKDGHVIKIERSGNPVGKPVFLLHGGPGAGANWDNKNLFDLKYFVRRHVLMCFSVLNKTYQCKI